MASDIYHMSYRKLGSCVDLDAFSSYRSRHMGLSPCQIFYSHTFVSILVLCSYPLLLFASLGLLVSCPAFSRKCPRFGPLRKLSSIYVFSYFPFGFEGRIWDLIVSVPDHCLSFYFPSETVIGSIPSKYIFELMIHFQLFESSVLKCVHRTVSRFQIHNPEPFLLVWLRMSPLFPLLRVCSSEKYTLHGVYFFLA